MIVSVRYTPRLFYRGIIATFKDKPLVYGLSFAFLALLLFISTGFIASMVVIGIILAILLTAALIAGVYTAIAFRSKRGFVPLSYNLTESAIKITYGDKTSLRRYTRTIKHAEVERVWFRNGAIFIKHKLIIHHIMLPEERRSKFIEAMRVRGWFDRKHLQPSQQLISHSANVAMYVLIGLFVFAAIPRSSSHDIMLSNEVVIAPLQATNIFVAVNSQRSAYGLPPLQQDQSLIQAAEQSCLDMSGHKYFGDKNNTSDNDVYSRGYYSGQWLTEVGAAVKSNVGSDAVASKWANNSATSDAIQSSDYTIAGAATCSYAVNNKFATIAVIELR